MKVLSLLQPWATLVVIGAKQIETRSWNTNYRGPLLIHASKRVDQFARQLTTTDHHFRSFIRDFDQLPFGAIIGSCRIEKTERTEAIRDKILDRHEFTFGDYAAGRYGWHLKGAKQFKKPTPAKGSLNLWDPPFMICWRCGCTQDDCRGCVERTGSPCSWESEFLCSACV